MLDKLAALKHLLTQQPQAGIQRFRELFYEQLYLRHFAECDMLLAQLATLLDEDLILYHQAVLAGEQRHYDQAETRLRELLAREPHSKWQDAGLTELAIQLDETGQWREAEEYYRKALAAHEKNQDRLSVSKTYNNWGICVCFQVERGAAPISRLADAIDYHQRAQRIAEQEHRPEEVARNWHGLGKAFGLRQEYTQALAAFQQYLEWAEQEQNEHAQGYTLTDIAALVYLPQQEWRQAQSILDRAIQYLRHCDEPLDLAEALTHRGDLWRHQMLFAEAELAYSEAVSLAESIRTRLTAPTAQAGYRSTMEFVYTAPLTMYLNQGDGTRALTAAERARSRVLSDLLAEQTVHSSSQIPQDLLERRTALCQQLSQLYAEEEKTEMLTEKRRELEFVLADLEREIELLDPSYIALNRVDALTCEEIQERLPKNTALLTYVTDTDGNFWSIVVTSEGATEPIALSLSSPIPPVQWLQNYLLDHLNADGARRSSLIPDQHGRLTSSTLFPALYKTFIEPVFPYLQDAKTIYIIPTGTLHYLPLGALFPRGTASPPLLQSAQRIVYAPSATVLLNYCHQRQSSSKQGIFAIAPQDQHLRFIEGAATTLGAYKDSKAIVGYQATRQAFLDHAGNYQVICFFGHGLFHAQYPMLSHLKLTDAYLYANEIIRELRLHADLVILAACETGRTQVLQGDEIMGLARAMFYAGTPSLLVTLWPVNEIVTRILIEKFFKELFTEESTDPAQALRISQNWLRTLTYQEACEIMERWGVATDDIARYLTAVWHMTNSSTLPQKESHLFAHHAFWSPYILIGEQLA